MYTLFHSPFSQHARRVVSLMIEAGLEYQLRHVAMEKGEHLSPAYLAVNPNHQVPTLLDGDVKIHESNAILRYLCLKHDLTQWYPQALPARAAVEQWLDWNQCRLSPTRGRHRPQQCLSRRTWGGSRHPARKGATARAPAHHRGDVGALQLCRRSKSHHRGSVAGVEHLPAHARGHSHERRGHGQLVRQDVPARGIPQIVATEIVKS